PDRCQRLACITIFDALRPDERLVVFASKPQAIDDIAVGAFDEVAGWISGDEVAVAARGVFIVLGFLQRRGNPIVTLLTFFLRGKFRVGALEPGDSVVKFVLAIEREAGLIKRFGAIRAVRKACRYVEQMHASLGPVAIEKIDAGAAQGVEFVRFYASGAIEFV